MPAAVQIEHCNCVYYEQYKHWVRNEVKWLLSTLWKLSRLAVCSLERLILLLLFLLLIRGREHARSWPSWQRSSPTSSSVSLYETSLHGFASNSAIPHLGNADLTGVERCLGICSRRREVDLFGNHANSSCLATGAGRGARHSYLKQCIAFMAGAAGCLASGHVDKKPRARVRTGNFCMLVSRDIQAMSHRYYTYILTR